MESPPLTDSDGAQQADKSVPPAPGGGAKKDEDEKESQFECNICFDAAAQPVVTPCGHLFCWPCLYRWFEVHSAQETSCPVCKSGVSKDTLVPLYGRGKEKVDPRSTIPERPRGQRTEAPRQNTFTNADPFPFGMPGGMQFGHGGVQVGFGPFMPFMGWGFQANFGGPPAQGQPQQQQTRADVVRNMLVFLGIFILLWILPMF
jgi:hypothetical protein